MTSGDGPSYSRREAMAIAATLGMLPTCASQAQSPAPHRLKGLDVGPITWRNIRTDYRATGDGKFTDFVAFRAFRSWALAQTGWVGLVIPPGDYIVTGNYGPNASNTPFFGIKKLVVSGYGARMGPLFGGSALINTQSMRHKIRSVKAGSKTVELIDRGSVRFLKVGSMVLLAGLDLQGGWGYPPNSHFNEWHRIAAIDRWFLTFERPIKYDYRDDWPSHLEGHQHELGGIGPAAICRTIPQWDCEHRIYGLHFTQPGQVYYFVRKAQLIDCRSDGQGIITGASEDHQIISQEHTTSLMEVDKLATKALISDYGPPGKSIVIQSSSVDEMHIRGGTRSIIGTARHTYITGGSSPSIWIGPTAYGISEYVEIRDRVVTKEIRGGAGLGVPLGKEMTYRGNGVFRYVGKPPQWFVPGAVGILRASGAFDHFVFRIRGVRSENGKPHGPILLDTDIKGETLPQLIGHPNAAILRHGAPNLTVVNCTGCPDAEELSLLPPNSPYGIIKRRTLDGLVSNNAMGYLMGRLVHFKVNVKRPYTGNAPNLTMRLGQFFCLLVNADRTVNKTTLSFNLRAAGERIITPKGVTGAQSGDSNLSALAGGVWMPNIFGFNVYIGNGSSAVDISGEDVGVRPLVTVDVLTDQEF